jgi:hypothetical protein
MDGSYTGWATSLPHRAALRYGLDDDEAADLSAGRSVFLPRAKPKSAATPPVSPAGQDALTSLTDFSVFVASCQSARLAGLMGWFRAEGASVGFDQDLPRALAELRLHPASWSALIVHLDGFGDLEDLVDMLLAFRRAVPTLPLILISASFGRDTLGAERLAICDVSLRDPVGLGRMKSVLDQAIRHNHAWQQRLAALTPPAPNGPDPVTARCAPFRSKDVP